MSPIPKTRIADLVADSRRAVLADQRARFQHLRTEMYTTHLIGTDTTITLYPDELLRIHWVQVEAPTTPVGTGVGMQVRVEGQDLFASAARPRSIGTTSGPQEPTHPRTIAPGSKIDVVHVINVGAPSGNAITILGVQPLEVLPRPDEISLSGRNQYRLDRRKEAQRIDAARRSTIGIARDQTDAGREQLEQVRSQVGRNARSLRYPGRFTFRGGQRPR